MSAPAFLRGLLGSKARLAAAAAGELTAAEAALLHRRGADRLSREVWSAADLPLLDEAEDLLNGPPQRFRHIVVDEAQDLSPMQLRAVARRSVTGSLTVVGDLAQSTGAWARDSWDDVLRYLPARQPSTITALRYGYRVPRRVYDFAAAVLPVAAPGVAPATVVREGPADPGIHRVDADVRAARAVEVARGHAEAGHFVGIVCPPSCRAELEAALAAAGVTWSGAELAAPVNVVAPREAKGLEFDAVVVLEPEDIVAGDPQGLRMLFVALTRTTKFLDVVCVGEPLPLAVHARPRVPAARNAAPLAAGTGATDRLRVQPPADRPLDDPVDDLALRPGHRDAQLGGELLELGHGELEVGLQVEAGRRPVADLGQRGRDLRRRSRQSGCGPRGRLAPAHQLQPRLPAGQLGQLRGGQLAEELGDADQHLVGEIGRVGHVVSFRSWYGR